MFVLWLSELITFFFCLNSSLKDSGIDELDDLLVYFEQKLTLESAFPKICNPELELTRVHISGILSFCVRMHIYFIVFISFALRHVY